MSTPYNPRTPITPTPVTPRTAISPTPVSVRDGVRSDLGYLITQLGTLCNNSGVRILFHTGTFYPSTTSYSVRTPI